MPSQVREWKSRWNGADLEAPSATAVEVHLAQHVCHSSRVRGTLLLSHQCGCGKRDAMFLSLDHIFDFCKVFHADIKDLLCFSINFAAVFTNALITHLDLR